MPPANSPANSATPVETPLPTLHLPSPPTPHPLLRVNLPHPGSHQLPASARRRAGDERAASESDDADSLRPTHFNSPSSDSRSDRYSLSALLDDINSPIMDLASTLTVQAEQNVEDENLDFLRSVDNDLRTSSLLRSDREALQRVDERRNRDVRRRSVVEFENLYRREPNSSSTPDPSSLGHLSQQLRNERRRLETFRAERMQHHQQQQMQHYHQQQALQSQQPPLNRQINGDAATLPPLPSTPRRPIEQRLFSARPGQRQSEYDNERARAFREMVNDLESRGWSSNVAEDTVLEGWLQFQAERAREEQRDSNGQGNAAHNGTSSSSARAATPANRSRLYGWAPGSEQLDSEDHQVLDDFDFDSFLNDSGPPNVSSSSAAGPIRRPVPEARSDETNGNAGSGQELDMQMGPHRPTLNGNSSQHSDPYSLRTAALLHSVRRNPRYSPRARDVMLRYVLDRDRTANPTLNGNNNSNNSSQENPSRNLMDAQRFLAAASNASEGSRYEANRLAWQASQRSSDANPDHRSRVDTLRRRYMEDPASPQNRRSSNFEQIIKFLHTEVSALDTVEEIEKQIKKKKKGVCIDSAMGRFRPPYCSWLSPGIVFSGFQQAAPSAATATIQQSSYRSSASQTISPNHVPITNPNRTFDSSRPWLLVNENNPQPRFSASPTPIAAQTNTTANATPATPHHDRWTVKVTIHDVNYDNMTLQGTMEAFNVPSPMTSRQNSLNAALGNTAANANAAGPPSLPSNKTFCTYVEGELIDMATFTFQTESFNATPEMDATYWRKLEPFAKMTDSEIAVCLMDSDWVQKNVTEKYILMRWKEKCFVEGTLSSTAGVRPGAARLEQAADGNTLATSENTGTGEAMDTAADNPAPQSRPEQPAVTTSATRIVFSDRDTLPTPPTNHGHSASTFLSGADGNGVGLSISGFYYVSLRRSDGWCEGLYYDPQSTPYQRLEMKPECGFGGWGMGSWSFR